MEDNGKKRFRNPPAKIIISKEFNVLVNGGDCREYSAFVLDKNGVEADYHMVAVSLGKNGNIGEDSKVYLPEPIAVKEPLGGFLDWQLAPENCVIDFYGGREGEVVKFEKPVYLDENTKVDKLKIYDLAYGGFKDADGESHTVANWFEYGPSIDLTVPKEAKRPKPLKKKEEKAMKKKGMDDLMIPLL